MLFKSCTTHRIQPVHLLNLDHLCHNKVVIHIICEFFPSLIETLLIVYEVVYDRDIQLLSLYKRHGFCIQKLAKVSLGNVIYYWKD